MLQQTKSHMDSLILSRLCPSDGGSDDDRCRHPSPSQSPRHHRLNYHPCDVCVGDCHPCRPFRPCRRPCHPSIADGGSHRCHPCRPSMVDGESRPCHCHPCHRPCPRHPSFERHSLCSLLCTLPKPSPPGPTCTGTSGRKTSSVRRRTSGRRRTTCHSTSSDCGTGKFGGRWGARSDLQSDLHRSPQRPPSRSESCSSWN
mmetsp:Transcript_54402/g.121731  ORF Transcript_54402/g.121731 Transcript_54402/m.121731 type:complete len:200 (-) Transcript_54402:1170-1769(-)